MIQLLVIADVRLYRESLAEPLDRDPRLQVVATASSLGEGVDCARRHGPRVAVIDLGADAGLVAVRALSAAMPELRLVALSIVEEPDEVVTWAEAGISAYVPRDGSLQQVAAAVVAATQDELACSGMIAAALLRRVAVLAGEAAYEASTPRLTSRERQIVALIDEGLANKEIAGRLQIELPTVKNHVRNILEKLGARRRTEAVHRLRQQELAGLPGRR
jgi:two-component system, NarL family, nitrate/nitrite response regulator NarL